MRSKRPHVNLTTKLASALLTIVRDDGTGNLAPVIPRDEAKQMTAESIVSRFDFDHVELYALGGSIHPSNLVPRPRAEHREKSRKDTSVVAKVKRLSKDQEDFRSRVLARAPGEPRARSGRWPKRSFPTARKDSA
jgi:hypothetical protein